MADELIITSPAFAEGGPIPRKYTGEGEDMSPPLNFEGIDEKAKSIAVIVQDIDTPMSFVNHWVIWNIPIQNSIPENIPNTMEAAEVPGALQGRNIMRKVGYMGPKPPKGTHKYTFYVYTLDTVLDLKAGSNKRKLEKAMKGHILQRSALSGIFTHTK